MTVSLIVIAEMRPGVLKEGKQETTHCVHTILIHSHSLQWVKGDYAIRRHALEACSAGAVYTT